MKKRILSIILAALMTVGTFSLAVSAKKTESALPFSDVKESKWFYPAVKTVYDAGFMEGKSGKKFEPDATMTRAELVTLLSRLAGADVSGYGSAVNFKDMKKKSWFTDAVGWAVKSSLVNGYEDNTFRPNDPILRQELASLLIRFFEYVGLEMRDAPEITAFSDISSVPKWARDNVEALRRTGLIKGDDAGRFNPKNTASRAEVATITMRMLDDLTNIREYPLFSLKIGGVDISEYKIVYNENASESVKTAVDEIIKYVKLAVGVELTDEVYSGREGHLIYLDDTAFEDDETYSLRNDEDDFIIGGSGVRGVLYGAYEFLESYVGWRFLTADCDYMAARGNVNIADVDTVKEQCFIYRDPNWYSCATKYPNFAAKRKLNYGTQNSPEYGGGLVDMSCHTFGKYIPECAKAQPCLSSEETYEKVLAAVLAELKADPNLWCISVSQNDNLDYCICDACTETYEKIGHSGQMLEFVNRIAEQVEKEYPDTYVHTLAYDYTQSVPTDPTIKPRDNVLVQLCSIGCCFNHSIEKDSGSPFNETFKNDLKQWSEICDNLFVWDYSTNFWWYVTELGNLDYDVLAGNMRLFADSGAIGVRSLGAYNTVGTTGFQDLKVYLLSLLMQDPYMSEEEYNAHLEEFLRGCYGAGWREIYTYLRFVEDEVFFKAFCNSIYEDPDVLAISKYAKRMSELEECFDNAAFAAENDLQRDNIRRLRIQLDFFKINALWDEMYTNGTEETKREIVDMAFAWQSEMQHYKIRISEGVGVPKFEQITRPPKEWKNYYGSKITEKES